MDAYGHTPARVLKLMDKRTLLAILLSLAIWYGWFALFPPPKPALGLDGKPVAAQVDDKADPADGTATPAAASPGAAPTTAPGATPAAGTATPVAVPVPVAAEKMATVTLCGTQMEVSSRGGALRAVTLKDLRSKFKVQTLWSWAVTGFAGTYKPYGDPPGPEVLLSPVARALVAGSGPLDSALPEVEIVKVDDDVVTTRGVTADGLEITRTLAGVTAPGPDGKPLCRIQVEVSWRNAGAVAYSADRWVSLHDKLREASTSYDVAMRPVAWVAGKMQSRDDLTKIATTERVEGAAEWIGLADHTFGSYVLAAPDAKATAAFSPIPGGGADEYGASLVFSAPIAPGATSTEKFLLFVGLRSTDALAAYDPRLENAVSLGFFSALAWPLLKLLKYIFSQIGSWGWSIVAMTFLMKLIFFPLQQKGFTSSQAMAAIQPELAVLKEKHKDSPDELNRATMKLFADNGVNPLGGCLPMLVQMPVWFAFYAALMSSVELYQQPFLYLKDMSAVDPYMLLPLLMVGGMLIQQQLTPTTGMDPSQARMMKLMPLFMGFLFFNFPSGLVFYSLVNMSLSILQQWYIKRTFKGVQAKAAALEA